MTSINWNRVLLGGLVAGVIVDISEGLLNGVFLAQDWANAMKALSKPEVSASGIAAFNVMGLAIGIFAVWLYAAIRPRFGAGPKTALGAGLATWVIGYVLPSVAPAVTHLYSRRLVAIGVTVGLIEILLATVAGAYLYKEEMAGSGQARATGA
jgi:hypothetical protein